MEHRESDRRDGVDVRLSLSLMLRRCRRTRVIGTTVTALCFGRPAYAVEPAPTQLDLEVESTCTDERDFASRVNARSPRLSFGTGADAIPIAIAIAPKDGRFEGAMRVRSTTDPAAPEAIRYVEGASCEDVAEALSLVAVLTFDPEALAGPLPRPTPQEPAPHAPTPAAAPASGPEVTPSPITPPVVRKDDWRGSIGMHGMVAVMDGTPIGASLIGEMARGRGLSTLTFRLAATAYTAEIQRGTRAARLVWALFAPQVCPLQIRAGALSLVPCAGVSMGALMSEPTRGVQRPQSFVRGWISPRLGALARLAIAPRVAVEIEASFAIPIARDRYSFGANEVYRIPAVIPSAGLGVAMEL